MAGAHGSVVEVTIPATSGASRALEISDVTVVSILTPAAWTAADIVPECALRSGAGAAFGVLYDDQGVVLSHAAGASRCIRMDERIYQHVTQVRFKADGQTAPRVLQVRLLPLKGLLEGQV